MKTARCLALILIVSLALGQAVLGEERGQIMVGATNGLPPYAFLDESNLPQGFAVALIEAVGEVLGLDLKIDFQTRAVNKQRLLSGEIDVIASIFYTPSRTGEFGFTIQHSMATADIFTRDDLSLQNLEQLRGERVVVEQGSIVHESLQELNLDLEFVTVDDAAEALRLVAAGKADFAGVLRLTGYFVREKYGLSNLTGQSLHFPPLEHCFAVRKDNEALQLLLDEGLRIVKATGKYDELYHQWLNVYEGRAQLSQSVFRALIVLVITTAVILIWALLLRKMVGSRTADLTRANARLTRSRQALAAANEELRLAVQQLTLTTNQLAVQYEQLKTIEEELFEEKELLRVTLLSMGEGIVVTNRFGEIIMINPVAEGLVGLLDRKAIGLFYHEVFPGDHAQALEDVLYTEKTVELGEQLLSSRQGGAVSVATTLAPILDAGGTVRGAVAVFRDISEHVRQRTEIEYLSYHDHLTGILNRRGFVQESARCDHAGSLPLAVISADVNGLKKINDVHGHDHGDRLLVKVAAILQQSVPDSAVVARLGGDEFVVVIPGANHAAAEGFVEQMMGQAALEQVVSTPISIAFGIAIKEQEQEQLAQVFNLAERRMYQQKNLQAESDV